MQFEMHLHLTKNEIVAITCTEYLRLISKFEFSMSYQSCVGVDVSCSFMWSIKYYSCPFYQRLKTAVLIWSLVVGLPQQPHCDRGFSHRKHTQCLSLIWFKWYLRVNVSSMWSEERVRQNVLHISVCTSKWSTAVHEACEVTRRDR